MSAIKSTSGSLLNKVCSFQPYRWSLTPLIMPLIKRSSLRAFVALPVYLFLFTFGGAAVADCSTSQGKIVINEYNLIGSNTETNVPFVELKILDPQLLAQVQGGTNPFLQGAGTQEWTLASYNSTAAKNDTKNLGTLYGDTATKAVNNYCSSTTTLYIRIPFDPSKIDDSTNIVLRDNYGNIVDVLRAAMKKSTTPVTYYSGLPVCNLCEKTSSADSTCTPSATQLQYDTDFAADNAADQKNIQRLPDGFGVWREAFGGGNSSEDSLCTTNDNILLVTKTASPQSFIAAGSNVTYTITIKNGSNTTDMTGVTMTDIIPTGLTYVSNSVGATYTSATRTLSWSVGALAKGVSASMTVTATVADDTIAITNTATATSTQLAGVVTQGSATINAIKITIAPLTATVALNGTATYTVKVENRSTTASLYGVKLSIPQPTGVTFPTGAINLSIGTLAAGATYTYSLDATGTQVGTKTITAYATTTNYLGSTFSASADLVVNASITPAKFNCIETGLTASTGHLYTKLAGTAFSFDVAALKTDGTVETNFVSGASKDVTVELGYATDSACTGWAALSPTVSQTLTFATADAGRKAAASMTVSKAYPNLRCRVTDANQSPSVVACSVDNFAVRPTGFTVTSSANSDPAGINPSATSPIKAGANFTLTATALAGYNGTPLIKSSLVAAHTGAVTSGSIAGTFPAATTATGVSSSTAFTYSEVGYFRFGANGVYDDTYTVVDSGAIGDCVSASSSNTADASGKFGCNIGNTVSDYFGRFIPDHFDTVVTAPMTCTGLTFTPACPGNNLVYSSQPFTVQVNARNLAGTTTTNYAGSYAHGVTLSAWDALGSTTTNNPSSGTLGVTTAAAGTFTAGVSSTATQTYAITSTTAPTNIFLRAIETAADSVSSLRAVPADSVEGGVKVVSGRIKISNAYGSELLPLSVLASAQYFDGNSWLSNIADAVTQLTFPTTFAVGTGTTTVTSQPVSGVLSGGVLTVKLSKPSSGAGIATITPTGVPSYLPVISGTATFGIYKGNNNFIYQRESY